MIAHIAKEIKTSTDGIAGINACGDAWSSWKQECSVSWFVGSEAATGTLGELNTCAGYTAPGNNRVLPFVIIVLPSAVWSVLSK